MNPYDDIVAEDTQGGRGSQRPQDQTNGPLDSGGSDTSFNPYQRSVDEDLRNMEILRRQQSMQASMKDSGQARKARELGKRTGIPPEVAEEDTQRIEQETKSKDIHDELARFDQDEQQWMMRDNNLASLQDDLPRMRALAEAARNKEFHQQSWYEKNIESPVLKGFMRLKSSFNTAQIRQDVSDIPVYERVLSIKQKQGEEAAKQWYQENRLDMEPGKETAARNALDLDPGQIQEVVDSKKKSLPENLQDLATAESVRRQIPQDPGMPQGKGFGETFTELLTKPGVLGRETITTLIGSSPSLLAGYATGGASLSATAGGAFAGSYAIEEPMKLMEVLQEEGYDLSDPEQAAEAFTNEDLMQRAEEKAGKKALGTAGVDALMAFVGGSTLFPRSIRGKTLTQGQRNLGNQAVQAPLQGVGEGAGEAAGQLLSDGQVDSGEIAAEMLIGGATGPVEVFAYGAQNYRRSRKDKKFLSSVKEVADDARQSSASQDQIRELVGLAKQKGPVSELYIDAQEFNDTLEQHGLSPEDIANRMPSVREQFYEANAIGGDLTVSLEDYAAVLSETAAAEDFISKARTEQRGMSPEEADRWMEEEAKPMIERALSFDPEEQRAPISQIQEDLTGQLLGAGYPQNVAEGEAERMATTFARIANMTGDDPVEFYQQHGPRIQRAQPDTRPTQRETSQLDNMIDRLRRGEFPADRDVRGPSLVQFLREQGGIADEGGELAARDVDEGLQPFTKKLIQDTGMAPDHAAERAAEAGFISERNPDQLMEAIDREVRGEHVYSPQNEDPQMRDLEADLEVLDEELQRAGLDLNTMSNDEVIAELERIAGEQPEQPGGNVLEQAQEQGYEGDSEAEAAAWIQATEKGLDMSQEARMERARELGFDTEQQRYHGSPFDFRQAGDGGTEIFWVADSPEFASEFAEDRSVDFLDNTNATVYPLLVRDFSENQVLETGRLEDYGGFWSDNGENITAVDFIELIKAQSETDPATIDEAAQPFLDQTSGEGLDAANDAVPVGQFWEGSPRANSLLREVLETAGFRAIRLEEQGADTLGILNPQDVRSIHAAFDPAAIHDPDMLAQDGTVDPETDAFQRWFGDSKVVDKNGDPLVVYHGIYSRVSAEDLSVFELGHQGYDSDPSNAFYFTASEEVAREYTGGDPDNTISAYLRAENPLDLRNPAHQEMVNSWLEDIDTPEGTIQIPFGNNDTVWEDVVEVYTEPNLLMNQIVDEAKEAGFDSLIMSDGNRDGAADSWAVFDASQIKSATDNRGTFDPQDPNILNQEGAPDAGDQGPLRQDETGRNLEEDYQVEDLSDDPAIRRLLEKYHRSIEDRSADRAGAGPRGRGGDRSGRDGRAGIADRSITGREVDPAWRDSTRLVSGGRPARVWRGSRNGLTPENYSEDQLGAATEHPNAALGVWYTSNETDARERYDRGVVEQFYLDIRSPKVYDSTTAPDFESLEESRRHREILQEQGYDSIVLDYRDVGYGLHVVSFDPEQAIVPEDQAAADPDALNQTAFHGTPHTWDKASLDAIGTGEGAQAFGWGLYFAEKREIAEFYRDALTPERFFVDGAPADEASQVWPDAHPLHRARAFSALKKARGDIQGAKERVRESPVGVGSPDATSRVNAESLALLDQLLESDIEIQESEGNLVQAQIPDNDELLDWDAPLSEQPEKVQEAAEQVRQTLEQVQDGELLEDYLERMNADWQELSGQDFYRIVERAGIDDAIPPLDEELQRALSPDERASKYLNQVGIPGLRYLDATSRGEGDGTRNFVIWDEDAVSVEAVNDQLREAEALNQDQPRLSAIHNLSAENLVFADQLGGIAAPSIAVVTEDQADLRGFGEISLIGGRSVADPQKDPVFSSDAYTKRFPQPEYGRASEKKAKALVDRIRPYAQKFDDRGVDSVTWDSAINTPDPQEMMREWRGSFGAKAMYLEEVHGEQVEPAMEEARLQAPFVEMPAFREWKADRQAIREGPLPEGYEVQQIEGREDYAVMGPDGEFVTPAEMTESMARRDFLEDVLNPKPGTERYRQYSEAVDKAIQQYAEQELADFKPEDRQKLIETLRREYFSDRGEIAFGKNAAIDQSWERVGQREVDRMATRNELEQRLEGREGDFDRWLRDTVMDIFPEPQIRLGRRKVPYTLDNIVEAMTRQGTVKGEESTLVFGGGEARAQAAEQFSDIEAMREAAKDAIVDPEAYGEAKEQTEALQDEFRQAVAKYYRFGSLMNPDRVDTWAAFDGAMRAIGRVAGLKNRNRQTMTTALRREDFDVGSIPEDIINKGLEAVEATRSAPVPYFEAKPQRAVQISEFEGAVIPEDAAPEVREILERNGIEYVEASQENRVEALRVLRSRLADQGKDVLFQNQDRRRRRDDPRGTFFYDTMDRAVIQLSEAADLTTLPHESYHLFLDILNSVKGRSTEVQGELAKVREWLSRNTDDLRRDAQKYARDAGLTDAEAQIKEMPDEQLQQFYADNDLSLRGLPENGVDRMLAKAGLEYFARGGEAYLMEGKAPSADMAGVFRRLKQWFIQVYESAKQLGVNLDDDIRGVFDRMIATEEQIDQARELAEYGTTLADVDTLDWTEAEREKVARLNGEAREQAERELMREQMKDHQKTQQQWWDNEKAEVRREVLDELNKQPVYQARAMLTSGTRPDGEALPEGVEPIKLDREALVAEFGEEYIQRLPSPRNPGNKASSYTYTREGGVDPQMVARLYGFNNTRGLVEALIESRPIQTYVDNLVEAEMRQRHPNINFSGEAVEAAREAVYNDKQAQVMLAEMRKLEGRVGARESLPQMFRNKARESVESKAIKDLRPDLYQRKSAKFEREAMRAAMDSRFQGALEAKQKALMHHYLFREASRAREESEKIYRYAKRLSKKSAQERIGKAGADYLDRVNEILGQYEFRRVTKKEIERRKSLRDWVEEKQNNGDYVDIPETVLARAETVNWREITLDELAGMRDALKNLEHVARFKNRLVTDKERRELQEVVDAVTEHLDKTQGQKKGKGFFEQKKWAENMREAGQDYASIALNMDSIVRALDGYEEVGPVYRAIKRPIDEAARNRLPALQQQYGEQMMEMYNRHFTRQEQREMVKDNWVEVEGRGWISREQALSLALNWGNEYNREAVMAGVASARDRLKPDEVRTILDSLTKADWDFAQDVWDMMDYDLWPQVKEAQRRRTGVTPEKVEASPVQTKFGTYRGGYYPVSFDRALDWRVTAQEAESMAQEVRMGVFSKAQTQRGHTIARTGTAQQPVKLSLNVLHGHVNQVLTDLALGDAINDVSKVLNNNDFKSAMQRTGNSWALRAMDSWLKDTAAQEVVGQDVLSKFARRVRTGFTVSKLAWNLGTILLQPTGLAQSTVLVGYRDMASGLSSFAKGKWVGEGNIVEQVRSRSKFMETRGASFNKDIDATQAALQGSGLMEAMLEKIPLLQTLTKQHGAQRTSEMIKGSLLGGIVAVQQIVDTVTWLGAYEKGKREQPSDSDAVQYADNMVARTQASGLFSDRTAFERGSLNNNTRQSEFVRLWTVLGSYMFAKGNIMYERTGNTDFKSPTQILKWTHDMALLFVFESLFIGVMRNLMPDEDDEESRAAWVAGESMNSVLATMPLIRDGASVLQGFQGGGALGSFWEQVGRAGVQVSQGEVDAALLENLNDVGGTIFRYPSGQMNRTFSAMWEDMNGEDVEMIDYLLWRQQEE